MNPPNSIGLTEIGLLLIVRFGQRAVVNSVFCCLLLLAAGKAFYKVFIKSSELDEWTLWSEANFNFVPARL